MNRKLLNIAVISAFFLSASASAQKNDSLSNVRLPNGSESEKKTFPLSNNFILPSTVSVGGGLIHLFRYQPLWKNFKRDFFFREDYSYAHNQDKLFHLWGSAAAAEIFSSLYSEDESSYNPYLYGGFTSALLLTIVEVEDGFISYEGFDRYDFAADLAGAAYPLLQRAVPQLNAFTPKLSYSRSGRDVTSSGQLSTSFLNDHQGQSIWVGITVEDLLPRQWKPYWPDILGIAVGRCVDHLQTPRETVDYLIALDIDLRKIETNSSLLKKILTALNYIHLPLPAVKFGRSAVWYGLYF